MRYIVYFFAAIGLLFVIGTIYLNVRIYTVGGSDSEVDLSDYTYESMGFKEDISEYLYLDHEVSDPSKLNSPPPAGNAELFGIISFNGAPVSGVHINLILNGKFKTASLVSDENGRFSAKVEPGDWTVNLIIVDSWKDKPEGEFIVLTGRERKLGNKNYYIDRADGGNKFSVAENKSLQIADLKISKRIDVVSPVQDKNVVADQDFVIAWEENDEAASYLAKISSVTKVGSSTQFVTHFEKKLTENLLPILDLPLAPEEGAKDTYAVTIFAFDQNGDLVSQNSGYYEHQFTLENYVIQDRESMTVLGEDGSLESIKKHFEDKKRLSAVEVLLDDGLIDAAGLLLQKISDDEGSGEKNALTGYYLALKGQCEEADRYFKNAVAVDGPSCVPDRYRQLCK